MLHHRLRMFALVPVLVVASFGFSACGADEVAVPADPVLAEGQRVYASSCASCHGVRGQGASGSRLAGVVAERYPNIEDQIAVITDGQGPMPAFGTRLTPEEIEAVARYTREYLGQ